MMTKQQSKACWFGQSHPCASNTPPSARTHQPPLLPHSGGATTRPDNYISYVCH
ncbi:hypothetical protein JYU34_015158 [Plutella xylostella]|uniref:Uncharacterized protein n=1 Tax=Plutella xylostella TaxID=51655 RepID=A0ABQ7Q6F7_PLUXY|nr:hypothetical protein JYU34_015158 [Plutella xylostella]